MKLRSLLSLPLALVLLGGDRLQAQYDVKLTASDMAQAAYFGQGVALWGDTALIGAPGDHEIAVGSGAAYVFERNGSGWTEVQKLKASDAEGGDRFGTTVVMDGSVAAIGAIYEDPQGVSGAGSVYIFEKIGGTWIETAKLIASDGTQNDFFGKALALQGDRLVVGMRDDAGGTGSAYVFERAGGIWTQTAKLVASDRLLGDTFGTAVALWGDLLVVGAPGVDLPNATNIGAVYVFELGPAGWQETAKLIPQDGAAGDVFGGTVDVNDHGLMVGSPGHDSAGSNAGAVYYYQRDALGWYESSKFFAADARNNQFFGLPVSMDGTLAVIGAMTDGDNGIGAGAAYALRRIGGTWVQLAKLLPRDGLENSLFGMSAAMYGETALVGAPYSDEACGGLGSCNSGSAYVFDLAPTAVQYCSCQTLAPCGNVDIHGGCVNSTGRGAELSACGSGSVTSDDLMLVASRLPLHKTALIYMGGKPVQLPFGDGQRCVGAGQTGRYLFQLRNSGPEGVITLGPGIAGLSQGLPSPGRIDAGETWYFQCWFRDSQGPCGTRYNLSNGVAVTFGP